MLSFASRSRLLAVLAAAVVWTGTSAPAVPDAPTTKLLIDTLAASQDLSIYSTLLVATNFTLFVGSAGVTLFAPVNSAFESLPAGVLAALTSGEHDAEVAGVINRSVLPGLWTLDALALVTNLGVGLDTASGFALVIAGTAAALTVNGATVGTVTTRADASLAGAVTLYALDSVILVPSLSSLATPADATATTSQAATFAPGTAAATFAPGTAAATFAPGTAASARAAAEATSGTPARASALAGGLLALAVVAVVARA